MAKWCDLPNELRDMILAYLTASIILEYWNLETVECPDDSCSLHPPSVLLHYAWIHRTCRYFHYAIMYTIKWTFQGNGLNLGFEPMSTREILILFQAGKIKAISNTAPSLFMRPSFGHKVPLNCQDFRHVFQLVGSFWNNPLVLENLSLAENLSIAKFISDIQVSECFPLVYKLFEKWGEYHATGANRHITFPIQFSPDQNLSVLSFVSGSSYKNDNGWIVFTIDRVLNTRDKDWSIDVDTTRLNPLSPSKGTHGVPLLEDLLMAPPNTWWLLVQEINRIHSLFPRWYIWDSRERKRYYTCSSLMESFPLLEGMGKQRIDKEHLHAR